MTQQTPRYVKLNSVGSAIDRYTLRVFPLMRDDTISFEEKMEFVEITNGEWFEQMSPEDRQAVHSAIEDLESRVEKAKQLIAELEF